MLSFHVGAASIASGHYGGGGSGGRVAIFLTSKYRFTGTVTAYGGNGYRPGGPGTVFIQVSVVNVNSTRLIIDNLNRAESYYVTLKVPTSKVDVLELRRKAVITFPQVCKIPYFVFHMKQDCCS